MKRTLAMLFFAGALGMGSHATADDLGAQRAAAHQLIRGQLETGLLDYDMDFFAGTGFGSGKSSREKAAFIARQAAAAYGLAKYHEQTKDERVREPLVKLMQALGDASLPIGKSAPQRLVESTGILSLPFLRLTLRSTLDELGLLYVPSGDGTLVGYEQGYATTWAGTTAMALLAELHYFRATGDARFAPLRERWRNGLDTLRVPGKGFREFPDLLDEGPYVNGEAWLALALYVETFPGGNVSAEEMQGVDDYMTGTYASPDKNAFFHWGAMAAARRYLATKNRRLIEFIEKASQAALDAAPPVDGPYNSCPLVEGLAASASAIARSGRADSLLHRALRARIRAEMDKNNGLQLAAAQDRLAFGGDSYLVSPRLGAYAGAYLFGRYTPMVRIDMTHHCISAITEMQWR
jgi:hypothetical protein